MTFDDAEKGAAPEYRRLLEDKAEKLTDLMKRSPGQKHYKRSLTAFLEADAKAQKALMKHIGEAHPGSRA